MQSLLHSPRKPTWERLRQRLTMPGNACNVTLEYVDATNRYVWTPIWDRYWCRWGISQVAATSFWAITDLDIYDVVKAWDCTDGSITYSPTHVDNTEGRWRNISDGASLNGLYYRQKIANDYLEFSVTVPANGKIYIVVAALANGAYGSVLIDGATTLVNGADVDASFRISSYAAVNTPNTRREIARGLAAGTYTVRITVITAQVPPGSSNGPYINFEGYGIHTTTINDSQIALLYDRKALTLGNIGFSSSLEYAYSYKPTGASSYQWTGTGHGNEAGLGTTWLDGNNVDVSVADGTFDQEHNSGSKIVITNTGTSRHSQVGAGATEIANFTSRITFDNAGFTSYHRHDWLVAASFDQAYAAMFAFFSTATEASKTITRGHVAGIYNTLYTLSQQNDVDNGEVRSQLAACWHPSNSWVAWLYLPNLDGVDTWRKSAQFMFIQDRSVGGGGLVNKVYAQRVGGTANQANASASIGDIWESTAQYRVSWFTAPSTDIEWE